MPGTKEDELSEKYEQLALANLGETRHVRKSSLKEFVKWINDNKKIVSCPKGKVSVCVSDS